VTIGELLLVPKGTLTKASSGRRRHKHLRDLYCEGKLEVLCQTGEKPIF